MTRIFQRPPEAGVRRLLADCGLPDADLTPEHFEHFFGCGSERELEGVVGVELHGTDALLRSLAVAQSARGRGCGSALVAEAERYARTRGVTRMYLLTATAEPFFQKRGYARTPRESAPESLRTTREFAALCPASATFMLKALPAPRPPRHGSAPAASPGSSRPARG